MFKPLSPAERYVFEFRFGKDGLRNPVAAIEWLEARGERDTSALMLDDR